MAKVTRELSKLTVYSGEYTNENNKVQQWTKLVITSVETAVCMGIKVPKPNSEWHDARFIDGEFGKQLAEFAKLNGSPLDGIDDAWSLSMSNADQKVAIEKNYPQLACLYTCFGMKQRQGVITFDRPHARVDKDGQFITGAKPVMYATCVYYTGGDANLPMNEFGKEASELRRRTEYAPLPDLPGVEEEEVGDDADTGE